MGPQEGRALAEFDSAIRGDASIDSAARAEVNVATVHPARDTAAGAEPHRPVGQQCARTGPFADAQVTGREHLVRTAPALRQLQITGACHRQLCGRRRERCRQPDLDRVDARRASPFDALQRLRERRPEHRLQASPVTRREAGRVVVVVVRHVQRLHVGGSLQFDPCRHQHQQQQAERRDQAEQHRRHGGAPGLR